VNPRLHTMQQVYEKFSLDKKTIDFVGHAIALETNDSYLSQPCGPTMEKIKLYISSFERHGKSPFVYPIYGLGGLPEGFSRLCAIYGGTYMLNTPVDGFVYGEDGKVTGMRSGENVVKAPMIICDPSYVIGTNKIKSIGKIIRSICLLTEPIPNTHNVSACQIIIPQSELNRRTDIYVTMISSEHRICPAGWYVAIISTTVETDDPEKEIEPAYRIMGTIKEKFTNVTDIYISRDDGKLDNVHVSSSVDVTSHFENTTQEVFKLWEQITGSPLVVPENIEDVEE